MRPRAAFLAAVALALLSVTSGSRAQAPAASQHRHALQASGKAQPLKYLVFLPPEYGAGERSWPVILFLHGAAQRGSNLEAVKKTGLPLILERQAEFPAIVVAPQCPAGLRWTTPAVLDGLLGVLDEVGRSYAVDADRVYVTGLSLGGFGTWGLAMREPGRFAAIAPICGGAQPSRACLLKDTPVWIYHGARDTGVPAHRAKAMYAALEACGADVHFTLYPQAGHDAWTPAYSDPEFYTWLFGHARRPAGSGPAAPGTVTGRSQGGAVAAGSAAAAPTPEAPQDGAAGASGADH
ncbi:MAG: dienelactone hydrolase family protein [Gemmatimonadota bacterium]